MDSSCSSLICPYKTECNSFKYMKFSVYLFHIVICQLSIRLIHKYIGVMPVETKVVAISDPQYRACQHANRQICRIILPLQPLANVPSCVTALYAKNYQAIKEQYSLVISHMPHIFVPIVVTSNLWIIPSNPKAQGSTMTIICTDQATSTVHLQQPFHILRIPPTAVLHLDTSTCPTL